MDYDTVIREILKEMNQIPKKDFESIDEYLENNEWGIAVETLCAVIRDENIEITSSNLNKIKLISEEMELESYSWKEIENNVK